MTKKTDKRNENIKEKILGSLLEGSKTTTQLLSEVGYNKKQFSYISKPLDNLKKQGFVVDRKIKSEKIDDTSTMWFIVPKHNNLKNILGEYESLLPKMHKSQVVLDTFIFKITIPYTDDSTGESGVITQSLEGEDKKYITEKFRLSEEFFVYYLNKLSNNFQDHTIELVEYIEELNGNTAKEGSENFDKFGKENSKDEPLENSTYYLETVFEVCVFMDILKGHSSDEAKEYLKKIKAGEKKLKIPIPKI